MVTLNFYNYHQSRFNNCTKPGNNLKTTKFKESWHHFFVMDVNNSPVTGEHYQNIF
jgi:hypothetical protein